MDFLWKCDASLNDFEIYMNEMAAKQQNDTLGSEKAQEEELRYNKFMKNSNMNSTGRFRVYRMFTTIWYNVVLDGDMLGRLQKAVTEQMDILHQNIISHQVDDGPLGDVEDIKIIIKRFMQAILDLSLNENSIHYLLHSHVVLDHLYEIFEDLILRQAWSFIKSICEKIYNKHMINDLLGVLKYYSGILNEFGPMRFRRKLEKKKTVIVSKFFRYIIKNRLKKFRRY